MAIPGCYCYLAHFADGYFLSIPGNILHVQISSQGSESKMYTKWFSGAFQNNIPESVSYISWITECHILNQQRVEKKAFVILFTYEIYHPPCIKFFSWNEASDLCHTLNATLPVIRSRNELIDLLSFIKMSEKFRPTDSIFIGLALNVHQKVGY